ncbi:PE-PGRS family protein PE_PGRS16-like [Procambarus clarkii]|uniref:PE-PGRS family protein PE_PGRS16-like n=1 Tax=Procambarus clarkii TaxID=6728 RepID=UPI0037441A48
MFRSETYIYGQQQNFHQTVRHRDCQIRLGYHYLWQVATGDGSSNPEHSRCKLCEQELPHEIPHYITECPVIRPFRPVGMSHTGNCWLSLSGIKGRVGSSWTQLVERHPTAMKSLVIVTALAAFCLVDTSAEPSAFAEPSPVAKPGHLGGFGGFGGYGGFRGGYGGFGGGYGGYGGYYRGKRSADPEANPGFLGGFGGFGRGYGGFGGFGGGYGGFGGGYGGYGGFYRGKRSAEPAAEPEANPGYFGGFGRGFGGFGGFGRGYGGYGGYGYYG